MAKGKVQAVAAADEVFTDEAAEAAAANDPLEGDEPEEKPPTTASHLFREDKEADEKLQAQRQMDRQVAYLITAKGLEKLRAFGFDVVRKSTGPLPQVTTDGRSLERDA